MLRLPDGMRDRIKAAASKGGRSMNAECVAALEDWLNKNSEQESQLVDLRRMAGQMADQKNMMEDKLTEILHRIDSLERPSK